MISTQVNLPEDLKKAAYELAKSKSMSYSAFMRLLLVEALSNSKQPATHIVNQHFENAQLADIESGILEQ